jgi:hypothetical protein
VNNEKFKEFIAPLLDKIIGDLGGLRDVQAMFEQLPEQTIYFVAGAIYGLAYEKYRQTHYAWWRDGPQTTFVSLTHEERRRMLDYVRLRIETESGSS